ncbi:MAG: transglycosylase domain-containing protein [Chloroflexota bacterium]|nr:transglycosylase domain-containing protein [Chloroflexota bacterium]
MSNNWTPERDQAGGRENGVPYTGNLMQRPPEQNFKQFSPISMPSRGARPSAPLPPGQPFPDQAPPGLLTSARSQGLLGNAMQVVRRVSGKFAAVNNRPAPPPEPLVRYRPPEVGAPEPLPKAKPWKRSRSVRLAMQMRHRRQRLTTGSKRVVIGIIVGLLFALVIMASSGTAYGYSYYQSQQPQLQEIANKQISQVTHIYDRNNVLLANVYDTNGPGRRISVNYDDIPQVMRDAMIAAEDPTFWTNSGVDPQGLLRALVYGGSHGGGSTITQQLIKNMRNDATPSINRKISEAALAIGLTQQYPKSKILEMYLNISPFGATELGVEAASEDYFGLMRSCNRQFKCTPAVSQLDYDPVKKTHSPLLALARSSLLAALPNNPSLFDPGMWVQNPTDKALALARQDYVLKSMMNMGTQVKGLGPDGQAGPITPDILQRVETMTQNMKFQTYHNNWKAPHFVSWVISQLEGVLGDGDYNKGATLLLNGGFNIRTSIDINLEGYVERAVARHLTQPEYQKLSGYVATLNSPEFNVNDAAVVVMNAKTGEVLAMDGSTNYKSTDKRIGGQVNAAVAPRQPGSTFKPIVYSTAFQMGWYPGIVLPDQKTYFPNGKSAGVAANSTYVPTDYGNTYSHLTTTSIRKSTANSFNIPALKALSFAGLNNVVTTARRMGITDVDKRISDCRSQGVTDIQSCLGTSLALGTTDVSLLQMVNAYQVFADNGKRVPAQGILDIWDNYGHNFYHFDRVHVQPIQVMSPQISYMMTSVLEDEHSRAYEFESDHDLSFWDWDPTCVYTYLPECTQHQVAAKTGTTDDFKDNWTLGFTPDVVVGVWTGNADDEPFGRNVIGITGAAPIWHSIIERVSGRPCGDLQDGIACGNVDLKGLGLGQQTLFPIPSGIHKTCVSSTTGLLGSGGDCDWMLDGQDPVQAGMAPYSGTGKGANGG